MANYQFRCPSCRAVYTLESSIHDDVPEFRPCPRCGHDKSSRQYVFNYSRSFPEHFNQSIGTYVNNNREFTDGLKRQSEQMSVRMGQEVDYQPLGPSEMAEASAHGVTDEGLEDTFRRQHDSLLP
jgi:uncharacterized C2H2 Zn-finger protein